MSRVFLVVFMIPEQGFRQFLNVIPIFLINSIAWIVIGSQNWFDWPLKFSILTCWDYKTQSYAENLPFRLTVLSGQMVRSLCIQQVHCYCCVGLRWGVGVLVLVCFFFPWNLDGSSSLWRWKARTVYLHLSLVSLLFPCAELFQSLSPKLSFFTNVCQRKICPLWEIKMNNSLLMLLASGFHSPRQI